MRVALQIDPALGVNPVGLRQYLNFIQPEWFFYLCEEGPTWPVQIGIPLADAHDLAADCLASSSGSVRFNALVSVTPVALSATTTFGDSAVLLSVPPLADYPTATELVPILGALVWRAALACRLGGWTCPDPRCALSDPNPTLVEGLRNTEGICPECAQLSLFTNGDLLDEGCRRFAQGVEDLPLHPLKWLRALGETEVVGALEDPALAPLRDRASHALDGIRLDSRLESWLQQFASSDEVAWALRMCLSMTIFRDASLEDALEFIAEDLSSQFAGHSMVLCPLGRPGDSSYLATYVAAHAPRPRFSIAPDLERALVECDAEVIVMVDDCIFTGTQFGQLVAEYLGQWGGGPDDNEYVGPLTAAAIDALDRKRVVFAFAVGTRCGMEQAREAAHGAGIDSEVRVAHLWEVAGCFEPGAPLWADRREREAAMKAFHRLGYELVQDKRSDSRDEAWLQEAALGYSGWSQLVGFGHNTPTVTVTALWKQGSVLGRTWRPLLRRR